MYVDHMGSSRNQAMLLWKPENVRANQFLLFEPGVWTQDKTKAAHTTMINVLNESDVSNWNGICASFIPGTVIRKQYEVFVDLT